jgi:hypothetical protein
MDRSKWAPIGCLLSVVLAMLAGIALLLWHINEDPATKGLVGRAFDEIERPSSGLVSRIAQLTPVGLALFYCLLLTNLWAHLDPWGLIQFPAVGLIALNVFLYGPWVVAFTAIVLLAWAAMVAWKIKSKTPYIHSELKRVEGGGWTSGMQRLTTGADYIKHYRNIETTGSHWWWLFHLAGALLLFYSLVVLPLACSANIWEIVRTRISG